VNHIKYWRDGYKAGAQDGFYEGRDLGDDVLDEIRGAVERGAGKEEIILAIQEGLRVLRMSEHVGIRKARQR